jgi:SHAQKYF class myb-like DNA-binding protein
MGHYRAASQQQQQQVESTVTTLQTENFNQNVSQEEAVLFGQDEMMDDAMVTTPDRESAGPTSSAHNLHEESSPGGKNNASRHHETNDKTRAIVQIRTRSQQYFRNGSSEVESAGRWTTEEHDAFLLGLERYGNHPKKIAAVLVKTRTMAQIRNHAQMYFRSLAKTPPAATSSPTAMMNGAAADAAAGENSNANLSEFIRDKWIQRMMADVDNDQSTPPSIKGGLAVKKGTQDFPTVPEIAPQVEKESSQDALEGYAVTATPNNTVWKERYSLNGAKENDNALDGEANSPRKPHHRHRHRCHLNEETINMLKSHLESNPGEYLDEDAVAARMLKTERVKLTQLCDNSEGEDDDAARRQAYQNAQDNAFAFDFYKSVVDATRKENPGSVLDKKTLDWLRRAMGLHRDPFVATTTTTTTTADSQAEQFVRSHDATGLQNPTFQGVARSSRIRKRMERETRETVALDALMWGITNAEEELRARRARKASVRYKLNLLQDCCWKTCQCYSRNQNAVRPSL